MLLIVQVCKDTAGGHVANVMEMKAEAVMCCALQFCNQQNKDTVLVHPRKLAVYHVG